MGDYYDKKRPHEDPSNGYGDAKRYRGYDDAVRCDEWIEGHKRPSKTSTWRRSNSSCLRSCRDLKGIGYGSDWLGCEA